MQRNPAHAATIIIQRKIASAARNVVSRYLNKISGPLLDRIDLHVEVTPVSFDELASMERPSEDSKTILERVLKAREMQAERFKDLPNIFSNAQMPSRMVREVCQIDAAGQILIKKAMEKLQLSARAYDRILKVARTAADLNGKEKVEIGHLAEAIHFGVWIGKIGWGSVDFSRRTSARSWKIEKDSNSSIASCFSGHSTSLLPARGARDDAFASSRE
jgi:predicted ATPase with chaperone activity